LSWTNAVDPKCQMRQLRPVVALCEMGKFAPRSALCLADVGARLANHAQSSARDSHTHENLRRIVLRFPRSLFFAGYLNKFSDPMSIKAEIRSAAARCCFLPQGLRISG
jgi:hypothetical protein